MPESLISWMEEKQSELNQILIEMANVLPKELDKNEIDEDLKRLGEKFLS